MASSAARQSTVAAGTPSAPPGGAASSTPGTSASPHALVVDVAGKVRRPGLYHLAAGSRVDDAVRAAGGALPGVDLTQLNLAAKLVDGQQVAVGMPGAGAAAGSSAGSSGGASTGPVDLNTASLEQLEGLPGVGPVLAQHILDWRSAHGQFSTVDQLGEVSGIGTVRFAALRPLVTV